jgi:hypothetical protein
MVKVKVAAIIGGAGQAEREIFRLEREQYSPEPLDNLVRTVAEEVRRIEGPQAEDLEISVSLSADASESVRPAVRLSKRTLSTLAELKAEFDFDPYV